MNDDDLLTTTEAAKALNYSSYTIREWIREGKLPATQINGRYRIRRGDLMKLYLGGN